MEAEILENNRESRLSAAAILVFRRFSTASRDVRVRLTTSAVDDGDAPEDLAKAEADTRVAAC
jgi:hypothetical protein